MLVRLSGVQRTAVPEASREQIECLIDYPGLRSTLLDVALLDADDAASDPTVTSKITKGKASTAIEISSMNRSRCHRLHRT